MSDLAVSEPCGKCGAAVYEDARFCSACGAPVQRAQDDERATIVKQFAAGALRTADDLARDLMKKPTVQKVAGGAVLGAGAAVFVPFVTMAAGATLGAAYVGYKMLTKD